MARDSSRVFPLIAASALGVALLAGCSGAMAPGSSGSASAEAPSASSSADVSASTTAEASSWRQGGFVPGDYGFIGNDADKAAVAFAYLEDGSVQEAVWDAPSLDSMGVANPVAGCTVHYGILYKGAAYEEVVAHPEALQTFDEYADLVAKGIYLGEFDLEATSLTSGSAHTVMVNGREMCRSEGKVLYSDYWGEEEGEADYIGYSTVLEGTPMSDGEDTVAWFAVVDDPADPVGAATLDDIATKTAESFRIE